MIDFTSLFYGFLIGVFATALGIGALLEYYDRANKKDK